MGQWPHVVDLDTLVEDAAFFGRFRSGRDDLDVMAPIAQNVCKVPDMNLLPPDERWVELRKHQDAHNRTRSHAAGSRLTHLSRLFKREW